jgi:mannose-6-phosphate isomerase-like protein (cupin superfamily)
MFTAIKKDLSKIEVFTEIKAQIEALGFTVIAHDIERPWGAFLVIEPSQIKAFQQLFFGEVILSFDDKLSYSPKILIVAPEQKLSWQYHHRRSELWKLVEGEAAIARSQTDQENTTEDMEIGEVVTLAQGERHRLIGKNTWGIVAEIWVHTDPNNPSNEDDIVRVQDDYKRN